MSRKSYLNLMVCDCMTPAATANAIPTPAAAMIDRPSPPLAIRDSTHDLSHQITHRCGQNPGHKRKSPKFEPQNGADHTQKDAHSNRRHRSQHILLCTDVENRRPPHPGAVPAPAPHRRLDHATRTDEPPASAAGQPRLHVGMRRAVVHRFPILHIPFRLPTPWRRLAHGTPTHPGRPRPCPSPTG